MQRHEQSTGATAGYTALELAFSTAIFVIVLLSSLAMVQRDTSLSRATLGISTVENLAQQMLFEVEHELASARGANPTAIVAGAALDAGGTTLQVDSTTGFPMQGTLLINRSNGNAERVRYTGLNAAETTFTGLQRGIDCTNDTTHAISSVVLWGGLAEVIDQDPPPAASAFDGTALELTGPTFFRGDGTGFSYRLPVDPANPGGGTNFMNGDDVFWGGALTGSDPTDCWIALVWVPSATTITEDATGNDLNRDGDTVDVFELGQIRRQVWDRTNPGAPISDIGMGPTAIIQEQCNHGGDLNGDGFDDPIFLWDPNSRRLHVRLKVIGATVQNMPLTRTVESVMFLRNDPEL